MERQTPDEIIHPWDFYDLFATSRFPTGKYRWFTIWRVITGLVVISLCCLYVAMTFDKISLFQLLLGSVAVPLWMGVYFFFPIATANVFNRFWNSGIIGNVKKNAPKGLTYQAMVMKLSQQIHSFWLDITGLCVIILFWFYQWYFPFKPGEVRALPSPWDTHWTLLMIFILYTFIAYIAILCLMRLFLVARCMYRIFHYFTINVFPWHPDGSCGLGVLRPLLWISQAMFLAGLCFVISFSSRTTDHVYAFVLLVGYLIVFPAMLTIWLILPHREMVRTRNRHLQAIADELDRTLQAAGASLTESTEAIVQETERLAALQKRYDQVTGSFPTWPLWISAIKRLGFTLFLPLLTSLVPAIIYMITKLME